MTTYLLLKWVHILSSILLVGTGFGSAFYLFFIHRTQNVQAIAAVSKQKGTDHGFSLNNSQ